MYKSINVSMLLCRVQIPIHTFERNQYMRNTEKKESSHYFDYNSVDYGEMSEEDYENWKEDKGE